MTTTKWLPPAAGLCLAAALGGGFGVLTSAQGTDAAQAPGRKPPEKTQGLPENRPPASGRLTAAEFGRLHAKLTKMSTEKVWSIPWQLSVREARERAARENKPVFLWISSNGGTHPLGPC